MNNTIDNRRTPGIAHQFLTAAALLALLFMLAACSSAPPKKEDLVFWPPPPDEPRIQFLKSISGSKDIEPPQSSMELILSGGVEENAQPILRPYGLRYINGKLYICDTQGSSTVLIVDFVKKTFTPLKSNPGIGTLKKPINLALDRDGYLYVADTIRREVLVYDASGTYAGSIGKEQDMKPVDVAVDDQNIYVLDLKGNDIKVFERKGRRFDRSIGKEGDKALSMPTNMTSDGKGRLYVTNVGDGSVKILDKDGHFLSEFGRIGDRFGEFTRPKGIAVDDKQRIWVVDGGTQNVQLFIDDGTKLLMFFGDPPLLSGALNLPAGIALTTENLDYFQQFAAPDFVLEQVIFVSNQMGDAKISIYGLGHKRGPGDPPAPEPKKGNPEKSR